MTTTSRVIATKMIPGYRVQVASRTGSNGTIPIPICCHAGPTAIHRRYICLRHQQPRHLIFPHRLRRHRCCRIRHFPPHHSPHPSCRQQSYPRRNWRQSPQPDAGPLTPLPSHHVKLSGATSTSCRRSAARLILFRRASSTDCKPTSGRPFATFQRRWAPSIGGWLFTPTPPSAASGGRLSRGLPMNSMPYERRDWHLL
jgi:hypothetical protein